MLLYKNTISNKYIHLIRSDNIKMALDSPEYNSSET